MIKTLSRFILLIIITALMAGCKLAVIVVEGGGVGSDGSGTCMEGTICVHQVNDTNFSETFTAYPEIGWYFEKWGAGDRFFCAGSTDRRCTLSLEGTEGNTAIEEAVASSVTFYLMPIFRQYPEFHDTITVEGKEWYQPYLFANLSWQDIHAVCPAPEGECSGKLNGYDMTGWTWASVKDVNNLFNYYIGLDLLGPGPDRADVGNAQSSLLVDGWHYTQGSSSYGIVWVIVGLTKDALNTDPNLVWCAYWNYIGLPYPLKPEVAATNCKANKNINSNPYVNGVPLSPRPSDVGAWFYRVP